MKRLGTFALLLLLAALLHSQHGGGDFLKRVRDKVLLSQPFRSDFIQQVYIDEEKTLEESGFIIFADRSRVKWQYLDPEAKTFILEGGSYRFYDSANNQLSRGRIGERGEQLIWELLFLGPSGQCQQLGREPTHHPAETGRGKRRTGAEDQGRRRFSSGTGRADFGQRGHHGLSFPQLPHPHHPGPR